MAKRKGGGVWIMALVGLILIAVGVAFVGTTVRSNRERAASVRWPTTPGTITYSRVSESRDEDGNASYYALVHYAYAVAGRKLTGHDVSFGWRKSSLDFADTTIARYPVGATVTVHYDPWHPETAVLEPGGGSQIMPLALGGLFGVLGLGSIVAAGFFWRRRRSAY